MSNQTTEGKKAGNLCQLGQKEEKIETALLGLKIEEGEQETKYLVGSES